MKFYNLQHLFYYLSSTPTLLFIYASMYYTIVFLVPTLSPRFYVTLFFLFFYSYYDLLYIKSPVLAAAPDKLLPYFTQKNTFPGVLFTLKVLYFKLQQSSTSKKASYYYLHSLLTFSLQLLIALLCYLLVVVSVHVPYQPVCYIFFLLFSLYLKLPVLAAAPDKSSLRTIHGIFKVPLILFIGSFLSYECKWLVSFYILRR